MQTSNKEVPLLANPFLFTLAWFLSGALVVILPRSFRNRKVNDFIENSYYEQDDEEEGDDEQWEEEAYNVTSIKSDCKWWNWGCDSVEEYYIDEDGNEIPTDKLCSWYQWNCTSLYYNKDGELEERENTMDTPGWFNGWGSRMEGASSDEDSDEATPAMKFVYAWTVIIFIGILIYGAWTIHRNNDSKRLLAMLILFANFSILSMFLVASGGIETEGRELESKGFFGQFGVLIFITNFWQLVFCVAFAFVIFIRNLLVTSSSDSGAAKTTVDEQPSTDEDESTNYHMMGEPVSKKGKAFNAGKLSYMESQRQSDISFLTRDTRFTRGTQISTDSTHRTFGTATNEDCCDVLFLPPSESSEDDAGDSLSKGSILPGDSMSRTTTDNRNIVSANAKDSSSSKNIASDDTSFDDGFDDESSVVEADATKQKPKKRGWKSLKWCMPLNGCQRDSAEKSTPKSTEKSAPPASSSSSSSSAPRATSPSESMTLGDDEMLLESSVGLLRIQASD